ncbi:MAG: hypothetical protein K2H06_00495 [Anaeroplasmataceae bacterium]|nr:hypothetical protein [Anaeroplasmataceae bacterium]
MKKYQFLLIGFILILGLASCIEQEPFKDYVSTNIVTEWIDFEDADKYVHFDSFSETKTDIISTYEDFKKYDFAFELEEGLFETKEVFIFSATYCSTDRMGFIEILLKEGKLYPLYKRKKIGRNEPRTDDFRISAHYVLLDKEDHYEAGNILFDYFK